MSGHSKWSTIKRKKGALDAKRGQIFTRLARDITMAARDGGGDPAGNVKLRLAIERARAENMPKDNIERAIKKGTGDDKGAAAFEEILYEAYAPHGIALLIQAVTDNRNRTISDLRHALSKNGGSMGEGGSVAWQFERKAYFSFPLGTHSEENLFERVVDSGADDLLVDEGTVEVYGPADSFKSIVDALTDIGIEPEAAELRYEPTQPIELEPKQAAAVLRTIEAIEDLDDTQNVYSNLQITDEALAELEAA